MVAISSCASVLCIEYVRCVVEYDVDLLEFAIAVRGWFISYVRCRNFLYAEVFCWSWS